MAREFSWLTCYQGFLLGPLLPRFPPSSLPFPFPSPGLSGLDFSPGGEKCLCGCVECGTCPMYRDLELTVIAARWINLLPGLSAPAEVFSSLGGQLWVSPTFQEWGWAEHRSGALHRVRELGILLSSPGDAPAALSWAGSCWQLCEAAGGSLRPEFLTQGSSLLLGLEEEMLCKLSEVMDWLWILLTRTVVEEFCRGLSSGQDFSRCWGLPEATFRQAESSLSALPVMTLDEKTFFFKQ